MAFTTVVADSPAPSGLERFKVAAERVALESIQSLHDAAASLSGNFWRDFLLAR
jgi:hypothetical protein